MLDRATVALSVVAAVGAYGCCFDPTPAARGTATSMEVRVPASVIAAHAAELPMLLFVAHTPGTLENRGLPLAKICDASADVVITWSEPVERELDLVAWIERTYPEGPPIPTCGPTVGPYREDLIAGPPDHFAHASAHVVPGIAVHLEVPADPTVSPHTDIVLGSVTVTTSDAGTLVRTHDVASLGPTMAFWFGGGTAPDPGATASQLAELALGEPGSRVLAWRLSTEVVDPDAEIDASRNDLLALALETPDGFFVLRTIVGEMHISHPGLYANDTSLGDAVALRMDQGALVVDYVQSASGFDAAAFDWPHHPHCDCSLVSSYTTDSDRTAVCHLTPRLTCIGFARGAPHHGPPSSEVQCDCGDRDVPELPQPPADLESPSEHDDDGDADGVTVQPLAGGGVRIVTASASRDLSWDEAADQGELFEAERGERVER